MDIGACLPLTSDLCLGIRHLTLMIFQARWWPFNYNFKLEWRTDDESALQHAPSCLIQGKVAGPGTVCPSQTYSWFQCNTSTQTNSSTHNNQSFPVSRLRGGVIQSSGTGRASTHLRCGRLFLIFPIGQYLLMVVLHYSSSNNQVSIHWLSHYY